MKKIFTIILTIKLSICLSLAQTFQNDYTYSYSSAESGIPTRDGGYALTGSIPDGNPLTNDVVLSKFDSLGNVQWSKYYGGLSDESGIKVRQTNEGGFIILGNTTSFGIGNSASNIYLIKTDSLGSVIWSKTFGGTLGETGKDIQMTANNGYIILGRDESFGGGLYVIKVNQDGVKEWSRCYGLSNTSNLNYPNEIVCTKDGGYVILDASNYFLKINSSGTIIWTKSLGFSTTNSGYLSSFCELSDSGFAFTGVIQYSIQPGDEKAILKLDNNGNSLWSIQCGTNYTEYANSISETNDRGLLISGSTNFLSGSGTDNSDLILVDSIGQLEWNKVYRNSLGSANYSSFQTRDLGFMCMGYKFLAGLPIYLNFIKTDNIGNSFCDDTTILISSVNLTPLSSIETFLTIIPNDSSTSPLSLESVFAFANNPLCTSTNTINNHIQNEVKIFPNPIVYGSELLNIISEQPLLDSRLEIMDLMGRIIYIEKIPVINSIQISLPKISIGVYYLRIINAKESVTKKIIVD